MKHLFSTTLLVAGVLAFNSTAALAYDLDHPFYTPAKGKVASSTSYNYTKNDLKVKDGGPYGTVKGNYHANTVGEQLLYGLTDNWTLYDGLNKRWDKYKAKDTEAGHGKISYYSVGTTYNVINDGRTFAQVGAVYRQTFEEDGHGKSGSIMGRFGYDLGIFTPFADLSITRPLNQGHDNHTTYDLLLAGYKKLSRQTSAVLGLDLTRTKDSSKDKSATLVGEYNYLLQQNLNLKVNAAYLLKNTTTTTTSHNTKGYSLGAAVQYEF